jgi:hypothetical protein
MVPDWPPEAAKVNVQDRWMLAAEAPALKARVAREYFMMIDRERSE